MAEVIRQYDIKAKQFRNNTTIIVTQNKTCIRKLYMKILSMLYGINDAHTE